MGWFSSGKRMTHKEFDRVLHETTSLNVTEREYVKGFFAKYLASGISKEEVIHAIRALKAQSGDSIDHYEADALQERLLQLFQSK